MYEVSKEFEIDYAHRLLDYDGNCARVHGHRAKIVVFIKSEELNAEAMVVDFRDIKEAMMETIELFDHRLLLSKDDPLRKLLPRDEVFFFADFTSHTVKGINPTAEVLAHTIFSALKDRNFPVFRVEFWETPGAKAAYYEG
jgi:6-pyruvoyltetrahydropterin/6-carboxytetrahydropterin synthase